MISNYLPDTGCFLIGSQKSVRIYKPAGTWSLFFNFSSTTFCFSAALTFFASPYSETDLNCSGAVPQLMKSLKRGIFHVESFNLPSSFLNRIFCNEKRRRRSIFSEIVTKSCVCGKGRWSVWAKNYCSLILQSTRATKNDLYHTLYKLGSYWPVGFFWNTLLATLLNSEQPTGLPLGFQKLPTESADIKMHLDWLFSIKGVNIYFEMNIPAPPRIIFFTGFLPLWI